MRMARRSGCTHKGVEEKRRTIPIYQHYTLSPGKTKSHHPEAKCNHCLKEFVCGSKQRLIRHIRKCNSITNPDQIIAETLNTLARSSATGQLNQSILEASNLLPSQISHIHHSATQQLVGQAIHHPTNTTTITTANSNISTINNISQHNNNNNNINDTNHNNNTTRSSLSNDQGVVFAGNSSNGSLSLNEPIPVKRPQKRGRKPGNLSTIGPSIHATTGLDGKMHFTPASQLPHSIQGTVTSTPLSSQVHNGRGGIGSHLGFNNIIGTTTTTSSSSAIGGPITAPAISTNSGHPLSCATPNHYDQHQHHSSTPFKLNSEPIDKAYLKLVLTRNLPISLCDTKEFHSWVKTLANDYKPPSSINLITQNLKREAQLAIQKVYNILVKAPKKTINLELHCWPDEIRHHHWYAMIAVLDHRRFLVSVRDVLNQSASGSGSNMMTMMMMMATNNKNNNINNNNNNANVGNYSDDGNNIHQSEKILTEFIDDCIKRVGSDRVNSLMFSVKNDDNSITLRARHSIYTDHPSIVTYHCWWHFTNLMCSNIIENIEIFQNVLRNSNVLMRFISKRPLLSSNLERFGPFNGANGSLNLKKQDPRWYSHLVCYLFEYIRNNNEAFLRAFEAYSSPTSHLSLTSSSPLSDSNNNNSSNATNNVQANVQISSTGTQSQQTILQQEDIQLLEAKSITMSAEYWTNLNSAIACLKPFRDLITSSTSSPSPPNGHNNNNNNINSSSNLFDYSPTRQQTPTISPVITNNLSLSEYMNWFLGYGRILLDNWRQSADSFKYKIIGLYLKRFRSSLKDFNLMFAAYLLNPRYRCAFTTQKAKDKAIEEILNIASEFMPEESDGHTIFDQWKLYLGREEPYSVAFDEASTSPLDWWMSVPCAESIRRVALRILRLRAFTTPRQENLFSQMYFYEDETKVNLTSSAFEDLATLRYFYDFEDKIGQQTNAHNNSLHNNTNHLPFSNGVHDRSQVGQIHNNHLNQANNLARFLPDCQPESNGGPQLSETASKSNIDNSKSNFVESYSGVADSFIDHHAHVGLNRQEALEDSADLRLENLPGYEEFTMFVDFSETGVRVVEEPIEKKKRKWTAQEIISKCQSNNQTNNNNNNNTTNTNNNNDIDNTKTIKTN